MKVTNIPGDEPRGTWNPHSDALELRDGMWQTKAVSKISYPGEANDVCFQVEDGSFWFNHRNRCIVATLGQFPPMGMLYDIGGGNGFVASGLQDAGVEVVLLEPGEGAKNALKRGVRNVVCATFQDACFQPHSLPAAGAFDVVEHIEDDVGFLRSLRERLVPGGRFYCTVPAFSMLWSGADEHAGHYRRYNKESLSRTLKQAGFEVEYATYFFAWLTLPIFFLRVVPARLGIRDKTDFGSIEAARKVHRHPAVIGGIVKATEKWELNRLLARKRVPFGTSLLCVARTAKA
jgi:SAM-dependent methyltransferase